MTALHRIMYLTTAIFERTFQKALFFTLCFELLLESGALVGGGAELGVEVVDLGGEGGGLVGGLG